MILNFKIRNNFYPPILVIILNIGKYNEITMVPTIPATTNIIAGSIAFVNAATVASTSLL